MTDTTHPDTTHPVPQDGEAARRQRARVEALLARPAATRDDQLTLADGRTLAYQVHAAFLPVLGDGLGPEAGEPQAAVLATAYVVPQAEGAPQRPVCFAFNGGPGSSSIWLQLGALGPKRVPVQDDGNLGPSPWAVEDNPLSWLAHFDLVFLDPPHTGWSISASETARKKLLSVDGDVAALAEVMRGWLAAHRRFGAPLYLAGESYGTTRGAALTDRMLDLGLAFDGVILVSCAMDLQSLVFAPRNDLPHALFLPGYAVTAQYHGSLRGAPGASPEAARAAAEAFVADDYVAALHAGARLDARRRSRIARRLAELTGLSPALVEASNLRITDSQFFVEALRERGRVVGRLESRATAPMAASRERQMSFDPGIEGISIPYTTAAMAWFGQLGLPLEQRYEVLNGEVNRAWEWRRGSAGEGGGRIEANGFTSTGDDLARALRRNPHLRVFVASGRYDLGTPYSATDWSLAQLDAPAEVLARVTHRYYDAGHMMYTRRADLALLASDLAAWLAGRSAA
ncbi:S10 family peptidase [Aquabacterium sp. OR-4]|uniref:S10 family peptidase n=1 Tax=Aquabacterium sp. OR-4 TaxID=2978127 RepID=UPI0021B2E975|nr:peptidase S10 [Aquabacterium sp. OR-4]MDT7836335.1 peptidase S10 [Aquabacterium sp. OR-4]